MLITYYLFFSFETSLSFFLIISHHICFLALIADQTVVLVKVKPVVVCCFVVTVPFVNRGLVAHVGAGEPVVIFFGRTCDRWSNGTFILLDRLGDVAFVLEESSVNDNLWLDDLLAVLLVDPGSIVEDGLALFHLEVELNQKEMPAAVCPEHVLREHMVSDLVVVRELVGCEGLQRHGIKQE